MAATGRNNLCCKAGVIGGADMLEWLFATDRGSVVPVVLRLTRTVEM